MKAAGDIWMQSLDGRAIDLLEPRAADADFREIAQALSLINRYAGNTAVPVSVALHTMIACDAAPEPLKPWVLLHDAHEARIGDITAPAQRALVELVRREIGWFCAGYTEEAFSTLRTIHDRAIHAAAGLAMPTEAQQAAIHKADLTALVTERRDFLAEPPRSWGSEIESLMPLARDYTDETFKIPSRIARDLIDRFQTYLPVFANARAARPAAQAS